MTEMTAEEANKLYDWCVDHDDVRVARAYLGTLDALAALDRKATPMKFLRAQIKVRDYLAEQVRGIMV